LTDLLAHTASLTSTLADRDQVIGDLIDHLNGVLTTVDAREATFSDLIAPGCSDSFPVSGRPPGDR